jgi:hypothetical protein
MIYLENNTTFSGSDIKVYAYRHINDFKKVSHREIVDGNEVRMKSNLAPGEEQFDSISLEETDKLIADGIEQIASGRVSIKELGKITVEFKDGRPNETISSDKTQEDIEDEYGDSSNVANMTRGNPKLNYDNVQTNKVNPGFIDVIRNGGSKAALASIRDFQIQKQNIKNKNKERKTVDGKKGDLTDKPIIELGSLYSFNYSSYREKTAVRSLGRVSAKDYTRGQRTIAGSMNFAVFQSHELMDFLRYRVDSDGNRTTANEIVLLDQLPKFNLMLIMINEYGGASLMHMFGVTISTEAQQSSANDLALMNNVTFYAEDIMTIENAGNLFETSLSMLHPTIIAGKSLKFYNGNQTTTLRDLITGNQGKENHSVNDMLQRSRGLF